MANNPTKDMFSKLNEAVQKLETMDHHHHHQNSLPKIQRVLHHQRNRDNFAEYYFPRFVSFGPIHYGEPNLQLGEQFKYMWASMYLQGNNKEDKDLKHQKILGNIKNLKALYTEDALGDFDDEKLSAILFVDACSLLQILLKFDFQKPEDLNLKVDLLALLRQDVLLLENQLPFQLLSLLTNDDSVVFSALDVFVGRFQRFTSHRPEIERLSSTQLQAMEEENIAACERQKREEIEVRLIHPPPPPHLLHHLRSEMLLGFHPKETKSKHKHRSRTYRNVKELREAGIRVKKQSKSASPIDISFHSTWFGGRLKLPKIVVDHLTAPTYLNLIAYETLPDFENKHEISSYVGFLDTIIDHTDDVKMLRTAGVLLNRLGSDEEVAKLFNTVASDLKTDASIYERVADEIEMHYKKMYKTWLSQAFHMYFKSPWTIIAFLAGFLALFLTAAQSWISFFPPKQ